MVELNNITHTFAPSSTKYVQKQARGRKPGFRGGCCGCRLYMHGRASKGSTGLDDGLVVKDQTATIYIDCDQQTHTSTARAAAETETAASHRVTALLWA